MTGCVRYATLIERVKAAYGQIDLPALQEMIKRPVALPSNLHNAIFKPAELAVWVAHAGPNDEAACDHLLHWLRTLPPSFWRQR